MYKKYFYTFKIPSPVKNDTFNFIEHLNVY